MLSKKMLIIAIALVIALGSIAFVSSTATPSTNTSEEKKVRHHIFTFEAVILDIGESNITLMYDGKDGTFKTYGKWIYVKDSDFKIMDWCEASAYFSEGENVTVTLTVIRTNESRRPVLLKIEKNDFYIVRAPTRNILRRNVARTRIIGLKVTVSAVKEKYFTASKGDHKILVVSGGNWTVAGDGTSSWNEILSRLNEGDTVWLYGRIVVFKKKLAGIRIMIFPRSLIDLSSGLSAVKE